MKLEGQDRERPWDDLTIIIGFPAMIGFQALAWCFASGGLSITLVWIISIICNVVLIPLLNADTARIKRGNQQMEEEIARLDAEMRTRLAQGAEPGDLERQIREGE